MKKETIVATLVGLAIIVALVIVIFYSPVRERFEEGDGDAEEEEEEEEVPPAPEMFDPDPSDSEASEAGDDEDSEDRAGDDEAGEDPSRRRGDRANEVSEADVQPKATTAGSRYYEGGRELMKMTDEFAAPEGFDGNRPARVGVVRGKSVAEEDEWWKVMPRPALEQEFDSESLARDFAPFSLGK